MRWIKKGLLYSPDKSIWWSYYYGILPTPIFLEQENKIRIYFATTDAERYGRITYIDVDADNPSNIIYKHNSYVLDIGEAGQFDDCGVNPSCMLEIKGEKYLYYIGYQRCHRVPYMLFAGIAKISDDGQLSRVQKTPILDRIDSEPFIRSATTITKDKGRYKMWYVSAHTWEKIDSRIFHNKLLPNYTIRYTDSTDGFHWNEPTHQAIQYQDADEFGFGRPWVVKLNGTYHMWYSVRRRNITYRIGYATSSDGKEWNRKDKEVGIDVSENGWDSEMICYPAVIKVRDKAYMFYNGNKNGETGFGYAVLENGK